MLDQNASRQVPRELLPWLMGLHRDAADTLPPPLPEPITIAGMPVTFGESPDVRTVADVAGTVRQYTLETLGGLLTILDQPAEDALTAIAKIRVHIDQLDRDLAAPNTAAAKRLRPVHDVLGECPKTARWPARARDSHEPGQPPSIARRSNCRGAGVRGG